MGCGGSTANATAESKDALGEEKHRKSNSAAKYETRDDRSASSVPAAEGQPTSSDGTSSPELKDQVSPQLTISSPNNKKKKKKGLPGDVPAKMFPKVEGLAKLPCTEGESTTTYTVPAWKVTLKSDGKEEIAESFRSVTTGQMTVTRPAPPMVAVSDPSTPLPRPLAVYSDILPRFTLNLSDEERAAINLQREVHHTDLGTSHTPSGLLKARMARTKYRGGTMRTVLNGFMKPLTAVAISSDDRMITTALGRSKTIPVRDAGIGLVLGSQCTADSGSLRGSSGSTTPGTRNSSVGSITGQVKIEAMARIIRVFDYRTNMHVGLLKQKCFEPESTADMVFTNEDQHLVSCSAEGSVFIWNLGRMKIHKSLEIGNEFNPPGRLYQVRISPDGKTVAACGEDIDDDGRTVGQVPVWDVETVKQVVSFGGHRAPVLCLAFHPNSKHIVSGDRSGGVLMWEAATGDVLKKIKGHTISLRSVHFLSAEVFISADERFTRAWDTHRDFCPLWTRHIDEVEGVPFTGKFKMTGLVGADDESDDTSDDDEHGSEEEGCTEENSSTPSYETGGPQSPKCPRALLMKPPANQSKLRQRVVIPLPCGLLLSCLSIKEVCDTPAPPQRTPRPTNPPGPSNRHVAARVCHRHVPHTGTSVVWCGRADGGVNG